MAARGEATAGTVAVPRRGFWRQSQAVLGRDWLAAWIFFLPTLILLFALVGWPFVTGLYISFTRTIGSAVTIGPWVGFDNYITELHDPDFWSSLWITVQFTFWAELFKPILGIIAALLLHNTKRFRTVLSAAILLPWIVPVVVQALIWRALYDPIFGVINYILVGTHLTNQGLAWLGDVNSALWAVIIVNVWAGIPFFTITQLAGLKSIDPELYAASSVDGANAWQRFRAVTIPSLRPTTFFVTVMLTIGSFKVFDLILLLTNGGPGQSTLVLSQYIYQTGFQENQFGYASAISVVLFVLCFLVTIVQFTVNKRRSV